VNVRRIAKHPWWKTKPPVQIYQHSNGDIACADALDFLNALEDGCADIVFLDPPFNLGKAYGKNGSNGDRKKEEEYLDYMERIIIRSAEVLIDGGALYLYHIPKWAIRLTPFLEKNLNFRHWIAISMKNGFVRGDHLYPAHYALLYYTKGKPLVFHRPKITRPICVKCKKDLRDYGGYKEFVADGINLSDIWDDISPVRHRTTKTRVANELPQIILDRIVSISGRSTGLLVDPFAGGGSSVMAAITAGMSFAACDREMDYCLLIQNRLSNDIVESDRHA